MGDLLNRGSQQKTGKHLRPRRTARPNGEIPTHPALALRWRCGGATFILGRGSDTCWGGSLSPQDSPSLVEVLVPFRLVSSRPM
eukprot:gene19132-biopygen6959